MIGKLSFCLQQFLQFYIIFFNPNSRLTWKIFLSTEFIDPAKNKVTIGPFGTG